MQSHMILFGLAMTERRLRLAARRDAAAVKERRAAAGAAFDSAKPARPCPAIFSVQIQALCALALTLFTR